MTASSGECIEYLGGDLDSLSYGKGYCAGGMGGTWVSTCPTANRVASCLIIVSGGGSRQFYYASSTANLAEREQLCRSSPYGGTWRTY